ncbi:MAG: LicD family protein [Acidaminococcaceae bacterium]|nr:LicD family protein [Acidaminococcaceae bacterium]
MNVYYTDLKELSLDEIHDSLREMLQKINSVCDKHGIIYFLSGGTAIGAIREKGFIPWDDDLDIMLPRRHYEKLITILEQEKGGFFKVYSLRDHSWNRPYSCLVDERTIGKHELVDYSHLGVTLDIFPMDGLPSSPSRARNYYRLLRLKYALYYSALKVSYGPQEKLIFLKKLIAVVTKKIGAHPICMHIDNTAKKCSYDKSEYVGCSVLIHFMEKERFKKEWFEKQLFVPFEGEKYPVMNGYDEYLTTLYGNYMKRPEQEGNPDHHTKYYWKYK